MSSLYQNEEFASFWDKRAGENGEPYKRFVVDPILFRLVGDFKGLDVLELGCGNGYLARKFIEQGTKSLVLADISKYCLENAKNKFSDERISYLEQDMTLSWRIKADSIDVVYSNMMLNEVENIVTPTAEAYRVLRPGGTFVFSVIHPAWDLWVFAQEKVGQKSSKMKNSKAYFDRGMMSYVMGGKYDVEHYHHTIGDYFASLVKTAFIVSDLIEPEFSPSFVNEYPNFGEYHDHPVGLIFKAVKK